MGVDDICDSLCDIVDVCRLGVLEFDVKSYTALRIVGEQEVVRTMFVKIIIVYNDRVIKA